ncbi:MAG: dockerin type I repeat-containing protein [Clostridiales bacterium]|nr:dockerin type I repeat-containing protein [Clostridiales bacterium]
MRDIDQAIDFGFICNEVKDLYCADTLLRGDADCNGVVNASDAAAILRHLVQLGQLTEQGKLNAKVTRPVDAPVSAADAAKILRFLVQLEKSLEP